MSGASTGSDPHPPAQTSHLALVTASGPLEGSERLVRNPQQAFGARLKSARERRGIPLGTVAEATKVATSLFEALERGDASRWPKGVYRRAFFRGYVETIGLSPDSAVDEFLRLFPDEYTDVPDTTPADTPGGPTGEPVALRLTFAPKDRLAGLLQLSKPALMDVLAVLIIAVALVWWTSLDVRTGAAVVALCCYPHLASLFRRRTAGWRIARSLSMRSSSQRGPEPAFEGDGDLVMARRSGDAEHPSPDRPLP